MKIWGLNDHSFPGGLIVPLRLVRLLISFALFGLPSSLASSVPNLGGTYKVTGANDLGSSIHITVLLHLVNASSSAVTITQVGIPSRHSLPFHSVLATQTIYIAANSFSQASLQFLVQKQDYKAWSALPVSTFILTLQTPDGHPATLSAHVPRIPN